MQSSGIVAYFVLSLLLLYAGYTYLNLNTWSDIPYDKFKQLPSEPPKAIKKCDIYCENGLEIIATHFAEHFAKKGFSCNRRRLEEYRSGHGIDDVRECLRDPPLSLLLTPGNSLSLSLKDCSTIALTLPDPPPLHISNLLDKLLFAAHPSPPPVTPNLDLNFVALSDHFSGEDGSEPVIRGDDSGIANQSVSGNQTGIGEDEIEPVIRGDDSGIHNDSVSGSQSGIPNDSISGDEKVDKTGQEKVNVIDQEKVDKKNDQEKAGKTGQEKLDEKADHEKLDKKNDHEKLDKIDQENQPTDSLLVYLQNLATLLSPLYQLSLSSRSISGLDLKLGIDSNPKPANNSADNPKPANNSAGNPKSEFNFEFNFELNSDLFQLIESLLPNEVALQDSSVYPHSLTLLAICQGKSGILGDSIWGSKSGSNCKLDSGSNSDPKSDFESDPKSDLESDPNSSSIWGSKSDPKCDLETAPKSGPKIGSALVENFGVITWQANDGLDHSLEIVEAWITHLRTHLGLPTQSQQVMQLANGLVRRVGSGKFEISDKSIVAVGGGGGDNGSFGDTGRFGGDHKQVTPNDKQDGPNNQLATLSVTPNDKQITPNSLAGSQVDLPVTPNRPATLPVTPNDKQGAHDKQDGPRREEDGQKDNFSDQDGQSLTIQFESPLLTLFYGFELVKVAESLAQIYYNGAIENVEKVRQLARGGINVNVPQSVKQRLEAALELLEKREVESAIEAVERSRKAYVLTLEAVYDDGLYAKNMVSEEHRFAIVMCDAFPFVFPVAVCVYRLCKSRA